MSTRIESGCESYTKFFSRILKKNLYQYDYRLPNGELFSCLGSTLEQCKNKRDKFLIESDLCDHCGAKGGGVDGICDRCAAVEAQS